MNQNTTRIIVSSLLLGIWSYTGLSQVDISPNPSACFDPIIDVIGDLEADKDPKCHATANRLEDFMFGTPLSFGARNYRAELQKDLVYQIWKKATKIAGSNEEITERHIIDASDDLIKVVSTRDKVYLMIKEGQYIEVNNRDMIQYSSIAYSLRAVLAIQQKALFGSEELGLLSKAAVDRLKQVSDMATLTILKVADKKARSENAYELTKQHLIYGENLIVAPSDRFEFPDIDVLEIDLNHNYAMLRKTIIQKLKSYEKYNSITQPVFLRNIQVYFAKVMWPKEDEASAALVTTFQDAAIQFGTDMLYFAERLARTDSLPYISMDMMHRTAHAFLPFEVNEFEDVTYFPLLDKNDRVILESYDLDAFRDSGLHWKIVEYILNAPDFKGTLEPDPFAAELLVETIAQFGVLLWRMGGMEAKAAGDSRLSTDMLIKGMDRIRTLNEKNNSRYGRDESQSTAIVSADMTDVEEEAAQKSFVDVTSAVGIDFTHRSADWLNRKLRSYAINAEERAFRLGIPPAFGGGGVAAEDINGDGYDDILLLSGIGNKLYLNNGDKTFSDITEESGILNIREDGHFSEPRQPIIADFNNDGHQDVFISYVNDDNQMFEGDGTGKFINRTGSARFGGRGVVSGPCTALDYNNDGLLDLYIGYFGNYLAGELPTLARSNTNGMPNQLYENVGGFDFKNVTEGSGVDNKGWTQAVGHTDIDGDGWQDLIVGNDFGHNAYYINNGDGTFTDKSTDYDTDKPSYTMNVGIADLNRDNTPDFYISNIVVMEKDDKYVLPSADTKMHFDPNSLKTMRVIEANDLFLSTKKGDQLTFVNSKSVDRGYGDTGWSWDADFFDADNDGDEDLYCLNGMNPYSVYGTDNQYYQSPEGEDAEAVFAESQSEHNVFFKNEGGQLVQYSSESGLDLYHTSRSAAYTDYDHDGDLDIVLSNYHGEAYFYENKAEKLGHRSIKIRLKDDNRGHNTDAIGATIVINTEKSKGIWREVHSTDGYLSNHPKTMHFGIGVAEEAEVMITWPDGVESKLTLDAKSDAYLITRKGDIIKVN